MKWFQTNKGHLKMDFPQNGASIWDVHEVFMFLCWKRMCFMYVSKKYQLHLEQASVTTYAGS